MEKKKLIAIISVVIGLVVVIGLTVAIGMHQGTKDNLDGRPHETGGESTSQSQADEVRVDIPEFKVISSSEVDDLVVVETTYGTFSYPYAFSDILGVRAIYEGTVSQLQFVAHIDGEDIVTYTIYFNEEVGQRCGTLKLDDNADELGVYVEFENVPTDLSSDWTATFRAAQETFNDVIFSMSGNQGFVAVD